MKMQNVLCETQDNQEIEVDASLLKQRISVYGLATSPDGILCVKTHSNRWELPGGTPELGETLHQALIRELKEEAGVDIEIGKLFFQRESFYSTPSNKAYHSLQFYFEITCKNAPQVTDEVNEVHYVPKSELDESNTNKSSFLAISSYLSGSLASDFMSVTKKL